MKDSEYNYCSEWVDAQEMRGRYFFTREDVQKVFPEMKKHTLSVALSRLVVAKRIMSPCKNFFVIVSMEYRLRGVVPEHFYVDQMMHFFGRWKSRARLTPEGEVALTPENDFILPP